MSGHFMRAIAAVIRDDFPDVPMFGPDRCIFCRALLPTGKDQPCPACNPFTTDRDPGDENP